MIKASSGDDPERGRAYESPDGGWSDPPRDTFDDNMSSMYAAIVRSRSVCNPSRGDDDVGGRLGDGDAPWRYAPDGEHGQGRPSREHATNRLIQLLCSLHAPNDETITTWYSLCDESPLGTHG